MASQVAKITDEQVGRRVYLDRQSAAADLRAQRGPDLLDRVHLAGRVHPHGSAPRPEYRVVREVAQQSLRPVIRSGDGLSVGEARDLQPVDVG